MSKLRAYLDRIGFVGTPRVDIETLSRLQRDHLLAIPYENLDVQLGREVGFDIDHIFAKIVESSRGGWCYEMNGLLEWALREIGFDVTRMSSGVARETRGDGAMGSHLVLWVNVDDEDWLVDVGFGDGVISPIPLRAGPIEQRGFRYALEPEGEYWRFRNHAKGGAPSYDFLHERANEAELETMCEWLQMSDTSPFTNWLVCQRFVEDGYQIQTGLTAKHVTTAGIEQWTLGSSDELLDRLRCVFGLDVPEIADLWPTLVARHEKLLEETSEPQTNDDDPII